MKQLIRFVLPVLVLTACDVDPDVDLAASEEAITGGTLVTGTAAPYSSVVLISNSRSRCSATKIGTYRFLTAAHCIDAMGITPGSLIGVTNAPEGETVHVAPTYHVSSTLGAAKHPSYDFFSGSFITRDIAVIDLQETTDIPVLGIDATYIFDGQSVTTVGYGCDDLAPSHLGHKQKGSNTTISEATLDSLTNDTQVDMEYASFLVTKGRPNPCPGDSGGPLLHKNAQGIDTVVGVVGVTTNDANALGYFTRVSEAYSWILSPGKNNFTVNGSGTLFNAHTLTCAELPYQIQIPGFPPPSPNGEIAALNVCQASLRPFVSEYFKLLSATGSTAYRRVQVNSSGLCLAPTSTAEGATVAQVTCSTATAQSWQFVADASRPGQYWLKNIASGKCLGPDKVNLGDTGGSLRQYTCATSRPSLDWVFIP